jgi:hypothetical protein
VSLGELKTSLKLRFYRVLGGCQGVSLISPFGGGVGGGSRGRIKEFGRHVWYILFCALLPERASGPPMTEMYCLHILIGGYTRHSGG